MPRRERKETTRPQVGEVKIQLSGVKAPQKWDDILPMIFGKNNTRLNIARVLLQELRRAEREHEQITSSDWLPIIIEAMRNDVMYDELAEKLKEKWLELERAGEERVKMIKILAKEAKKLQDEMEIQGPNPFEKYRGAWYPTLVILQKARMIEKEGSVLKLSPEFTYRLEKIARLWKKFVLGEEIEERW